MRTCDGVRYELVTALLRFVDAARLGGTNRQSDIRETLIALRSAIHEDESSSLCELCGPLGTLERLLDEFDGTEPDQVDSSWHRRWGSALEQASSFLRKEVS